jgi:DNA-directed RNA polymerase III subunit RPC6
MLFELDASEEITGGAWYTDQELDVPFIESLSDMVFRFILSKVRIRLGYQNLPVLKSSASKANLGNNTVIFFFCGITQSYPKDKDFAQAIYPPSYNGYPTVRDVARFVKMSGIITVDLAIMDVQMLLDRLWFDGKVQRLIKVNNDFSDAIKPGKAGLNRRRMQVLDDDLNSSDDDMEETDESDMWMYKATRSKQAESCWTDIPCGRCPVASFCKEGGPVNPENCVYYNKWLHF